MSIVCVGWRNWEKPYLRRWYPNAYRRYARWYKSMYQWSDKYQSPVTPAGGC